MYAHRCEGLNKGGKIYKYGQTFGALTVGSGLMKSASSSP